MARRNLMEIKELFIYSLELILPQLFSFERNFEKNWPKVHAFLFPRVKIFLNSIIIFT
jgi:hypothetical protein